MPDDRLFSPWRSRYVERTGDPDACVFCTKGSAPGADADNLVVLRGERCYVCMNLFPYNAGHLLVNPYRHVADLQELDDAEFAELFQLVRRAQALLGKAVNAHGYNVGINLGSAAGAGIAAHLHVHVIPRWNGDTNFMPTAADVRVVSQGMEECYAKLRAALEISQEP